MMTNCESPLFPTIEQLREYRRTGRVKADVIKSAADLVPVRNNAGELIGFGTLDGSDISKGADLADPNSIFDDSALLPDWSPTVVEVEKNATVYDDDDAVLFSTFPVCLQPA